MNADGSNQQQLTDSPALDARPSYSPNGKLVIFESDRGAKNNRDLYVSDVGGTNQHRLFTDSRAWDVAADRGRSLGERSCTITGTIHADVIVGTRGNDVICGLGGNDRLLGGLGNDTLVGGNGDDTLDGGAGHDHLVGGGNSDVLLARDHAKDVVDGGPGRDTGSVDKKLDATLSVEKLMK